MNLDGEDYFGCPLRPYKENPHEFADVFEAHGWYTKGHFPDGGTWLDQSLRFTQLIPIIDGARAQVEQDRLAKMRQLPPGSPGQWPKATSH